MANAWRAEVKGLKEVQKRMEQLVKDINGAPMLNAMRNATLMVQRDAKINAPVDTGRLRASITPQVVSAFGVAIQGVVGSNVKYAPYQELGTRPFWPPIAALEVWARRHHTSAFLVARAIARRGIVAKRFLQNAFDKNKAAIVKLLGDGVTGIVRRANNQ